VHQADVRFVDQGRGLQSLPGPLAAQPLLRQLAQFVIDEGEQLPGGGWVAVLDGGQDPSDISSHAVKYNGPQSREQEPTQRQSRTVTTEERGLATGGLDGPG